MLVRVVVMLPLAYLFTLNLDLRGGDRTAEEGTLNNNHNLKNAIPDGLQYALVSGYFLLTAAFSAVLYF